MDAVADKLENALKAKLTAIRSAVGLLPAVRLPWDTGDTIDLVAQGNRLIGCLEKWLLDDEQTQILSMHPEHLLTLYAAAYLVDIGLTDVTQQPANLSGDTHYARSAELIRSNWKKLGIVDAAFADNIARLCLGVADNDRVDVSKPLTKGVLLLAACLQLGRALDLSVAATLWKIYERLPTKDRFAPDQLKDYFNVLKVGSHPYLNGTIRLNIQCRDSEIHRALKHHERWVQRLLENMNQRVRPRFLYSEVIFEIEPQGYTPIDLKFSVDSSAGLQLFMGNRLYADKRVFLRELIQNAVDACNYRKLFDPYYSPAISIEFSDDISVIKMRDNGIGMTRQWIEKYFLAIGISFYQSNEIRDVNQDTRIDFGFISQFGIGFLSSFLVAEKIEIETRKAGHAGLRISISGLRDYFDVRVLDADLPVGTEVTLHLKASKIKYCRSLEFAGYLKTNIRFLQIPVSFKDELGKTITIGREPLAYDTAKSAGPVFLAPLEFKDAEGYVRLGAKILGDHIHALETASGGVSVFQDGIFVTQIASLLPEGARQHVVTRINLMGRDKCELSMDRNRMFWTVDQLQHIKKVIRYGLVDVANQLMSAVENQDVPQNTLNSIVNNLAIFFDFSDLDDVMYDRLCEPLRRKVEKRFRDFVRLSFSQKQRAGGTVEADGYNEAWQRSVLQSFVKPKDANGLMG